MILKELQHKQHKVLILPGKHRYFGKSGQYFKHFYPYTRPATPIYTKQRYWGALFLCFKTFNQLIFNTFIYIFKGWRIAILEFNHSAIRARFGVFFSIFHPLESSPFHESFQIPTFRFYFSVFTFPFSPFPFHLSLFRFGNAN